MSTNYTLDLNTGLTQVLSDDTNSYLYGNGRISQTGSVIEYLVSTGSTYHLGDALGSVRQLTDASGDITLAKNYDPYGTVTLSSGNGTSPFAYTGEQQDASGLTYLRARYYSSGDGRFLSRDTWGGDYSNPLSLNRWMYVEGNPVNFVDPTGFSPCNCILRWHNNLPTFFSSGVFGYDYTEWKQWPWYPPSLPLGITVITGEVWSRQITVNELGERWETNTCLNIGENGFYTSIEKIRLIQSGVIVKTASWSQVLLVVQIYQTNSGKFKPFNGGWSIYKDKGTTIDLPFHKNNNGVWPYPNLLPLPSGLGIYIDSWFGE